MPDMSLTTACTIGILFGGVLLIVLERIRPHTKGQALFREGFLTDLAFYSLFQSYILGIVIFGFIQWVDGHTSLERFDLIRSQSLGVQLLMFLILHDLYIYWFHRWQHASPFLWRIHEAHHSTRDVDWLSGSRSHSLEILINQTVEFIPIILLASPEIAVIKGGVDALWGMYIHSNIDVRSGWLQRIINGPEMHRWHHADDPRSHNRNFATKLAVWDWLFGTAYLPDTEKPTKYGLHDDFPTGYLRQHLHAFRRQR